MKKIALTIFLSCLLFHLYSQNQKLIDSLGIVLKTTKEDTAKVNALLVLADELRNNDPDKSIEYSDKALQISNSLNFKKGIGRANVQIGMAESNQGNYLDALKYLTVGLEISKNVGDKKFVSHAYNSIGFVYCNQEKYAEAMKNFSYVLEIQKELNDKKDIADCYSNIGILNEQQGKYSKALENQMAAIEIRKKLGNTEDIAASYNLIGMIHRRQGDYTEAMKNYLSSLKLYEVSGIKPGKALPYMNIGNLYLDQGNYPEAIKSYLNSLQVHEKFGNKEGIANAHVNIGTAYILQGGPYDEAIKNLLVALRIFEQIGNKQGVAYSYEAIGVAYQGKANYNEALKNLLISLKLFKEINDQSNLADTYKSIGEVNAAMGNNKQAIEWFYKGLKTANEIGDKRLIKESYFGLSNAYGKLSNFNKAYQYLKLFMDAKEKLNVESSKEIAEMKTKFETEKRDNEIKLLSKEKDILSKDKVIQAAQIRRQTLIKNSILGGVSIVGIFSFLLILSFNRRKKISFEKQVSEVEMKALRSQMNPHFIFNSLLSINNYMMDNDKDNASDYLGKFSKLMRSILENSRENLVPLENDLTALGLYMELEAMRFENKFSYNIAVADDIDKENTLVPPMILQPFVENAILHGLQHKEGKGKILIRLTKENNMINCIVEDDGIGRQKAIEIKEKTATHKGESLGMKITIARIDIINKIKKAKASVNLVDLSEGMRVEVKLPYELAF